MVMNKSLLSIIQEYFAADGEILLDHEFEDMVRISPEGEPFIDHNRLHLVRPSRVHSDTDM